MLEVGGPLSYPAQYLQTPVTHHGSLFKDQYWRHYDVLPKDLYTMRMYCDTAQKTNEHNDYTVFQVWGRNQHGIWLIDQVRGKMEAPQLESALVDFYNKHKTHHMKPTGVTLIKVEDKSSGSSLIQSIKQNYAIPIEGIPRNKDKGHRAKDLVGHFASGNVFIPRNAEWIHDYKQEFREFNAMLTHRHDDQVDPTLDAIEDLLVNEDVLYTTENLS